MLQDTVERIYARNMYADQPRGLFLIRGENVLLLGEIVGGSVMLRTGKTVLTAEDLDLEDEMPASLRKATVDEASALVAEEQEREKKKTARRRQLLGELGFEGEPFGEG